jgi:hypothetical protein
LKRSTLYARMQKLGILKLKELAENSVLAAHR